MAPEEVYFKRLLEEDEIISFFGYLSDKTGYFIKCVGCIEELKFYKYELEFNQKNFNNNNNNHGLEDCIMKPRRLHTLQGIITKTENENTKVFFELFNLSNKERDKNGKNLFSGLKFSTYSLNPAEKFLQEEKEVIKCVTRNIPYYFDKS